MENAKQQKLFELLKILSKTDNISVGLHTTSGSNIAQKIVATGLNVGARALEGTLKIRGAVSQMQSEDLDWFFPYTDHTVIVAIPSFFKAERVSDNLGGNTPICNFSKFLEIISLMQKEFPEFNNPSSALGKMVPSQMVLGYYDKEYNFVPNESCWLFEELEQDTPNAITYAQDLQKRIKENKEYIEFIASLKGPSM